MKEVGTTGGVVAKYVEQIVLGCNKPRCYDIHGNSYSRKEGMPMLAIVDCLY